MRLSLFFLLFMSFGASAFCFEEAAKFQNINPDLLKAIAYTESRMNQEAVNVNRAESGEVLSTDYGVMQINSAWFGKLRDLGISAEDVINNACVNVHVGAWVLAQNLKHSGENWLAVGAYNAGYAKRTERARERYIQLVKRNMENIHQWEN